MRHARFKATITTVVDLLQQAKVLAATLPEDHKTLKARLGVATSEALVSLQHETFMVNTLKGMNSK